MVGPLLNRRSSSSANTWNTISQWVQTLIRFICAAYWMRVFVLSESVQRFAKMHHWWYLYWLQVGFWWQTKSSAISSQHATYLLWLYCDLRAETSIKYVKCLHSEWVWTWRWFVGPKHSLYSGSNVCFTWWFVFVSVDHICNGAVVWLSKVQNENENRFVGNMCHKCRDGKHTQYTHYPCQTFKWPAISYLAIAEQVFAY